MSSLFGESSQGETKTLSLSNLVCLLKIIFLCIRCWLKKWVLLWHIVHVYHVWEQRPGMFQQSDGQAALMLMNGWEKKWRTYELFMFISLSQTKTHTAKCSCEAVYACERYFFLQIYCTAHLCAAGQRRDKQSDSLKAAQMILCDSPYNWKSGFNEASIIFDAPLRVTSLCVFWVKN